MGNYDRFSNSDLHGQRRVLSQAMEQDRGKRNALQNELARLIEAEESLQKTIEKMQETNSEVKKFSVDLSRWKGEKKDAFDNQKEVFHGEINTFQNESEGILERVQQEIKNHEADIERMTSQINHFNTLFVNIGNELTTRGV